MTHDLITQHPPGSICIVWEIDDVKSVRADLTDEQCEEVLQHCARKHDTYLSINWDVIRVHADHLFPEPCSEE